MDPKPIDKKEVKVDVNPLSISVKKKDCTTEVCEFEE